MLFNFSMELFTGTLDLFYLDYFHVYCREFNTAMFSLILILQNVHRYSNIINKIYCSISLQGFCEGITQNRIQIDFNGCLLYIFEEDKHVKT